MKIYYCRFIILSIIIFPAFSWIFQDFMNAIGSMISNIIGGTKNTHEAAFDYSNADSWYLEYPGCNGSSQSPIEIVPGTFIRKVFPRPLTFTNYVQKSEKVVVENTGHTVEVVLDRGVRRKPMLHGGPLGNSHYKLAQLHFHWGASDFAGSEHTLCDFRYSMEAHLVHYDTSFATMQTALESPGGVAVVAFFLQANDKSQPLDFGKVSRSLDNITKPMQQERLASNILKTFVRMEKADGEYGYITYNGSLTTPPCTEGVIWIIFLRPIGISKEQINEFRKLSKENQGMSFNTRPVQPRNGRAIYAAVREL